MVRDGFMLSSVFCSGFNKQSMRILAIEPDPTTEKGGSERSYFDVLTGLQDRGHQVTILYSRPGNLLDDYAKRGIRTVQTDLSLMVIPGSRWASMRSMWSTSRVVKQLGAFDIIYTNFTETLPLALLLKFRSGARIVCHIRISYYGLSRQILFSGRWVSAFIVINKKFQTVFEKVFRATRRIYVVYNGLTIPEKLPALKANRKNQELKLLYLGRIAPEKGVTELVGSFSAAVERGVIGTLQITGAFIASHSGDYKRELTEAIEASGISHLISIGPPVPNPIEYISHFDLFVFPSTWDEGFGRTVPEAILAGTPVLARSVGMIDEIMVDNPKFLFDTNESMTEKIVDFYKGQLEFNFDKSRKTIAAEFNKTRTIEEVEEILMEQIKRQ